ncbi:MAG: hypothetical protein CM1200mP30_18340 [Pseudomonadota bacterium]|nr:MAG: hypothetical protein CM1200mP30_18340 [Pseudomonadota bacterium]
MSYKNVLFFVLGIFFLQWLLRLRYYWQAETGHLDLLNRKQDIRHCLIPSYSSRIKTEIKACKECKKIRTLQLAIPENEGYSGYVELDRPLLQW